MMDNYQQWQFERFGDVLPELPDNAPEEVEVIRLSGAELQAEVISQEINY